MYIMYTECCVNYCRFGRRHGLRPRVVNLPYLLSFKILRKLDIFIINFIEIF